MAESEQINGELQGGTPLPLPEKAAPESCPQGIVKAAVKLPGRKTRKRKRVELGEAMRACGLDEHTVAGMYLRVLRSLHQSEPKLGAKVQFLKECARLLDTKRGGRGMRGRDGFKASKLIHKVPRPVRD
ncbi:MAG: hypothetical protein WB780_04755 [Candidatus Acidiferrales bacterium]